MISNSTFEVVALTHRGAMRPRNEDALLVGESILSGMSERPLIEKALTTRPIVAIADGMGGHAHGEVASRLALQVIRSFVYGEIGIANISEAVRTANDALYDLMGSKAELAGMGTTIVGAAFSDNEILYFNVGDSRVYRHKAGNLLLLSHDDVPLGTNAPMRLRSSHAITQSLGGQNRRVSITPHIGRLPLLKSDESLLLCSDGLTDMVDERLLGLTMQNIDELQDQAMTMYNLAMQAGGEDNISIILVRSGESALH